MSGFDDIIFPTTRSFCDDYESLDFDKKCTLKSLPEDLKVPETIENLFFVESKELYGLFNDYCVNHRTIQALYQSTNGNLRFFDIGNQSVLCLFYKKFQEFTEAEVMQLLIPWLIVSNRVIVLKTQPISAFKSNDQHIQTSDCFIKTLLINSENSTNFDILKLPNFVSGVSANVANYCAFYDKICLLHACYFGEFITELAVSEIEPILKLLANNYNFLIDSKVLPKQFVINDTNLYI